ncbi:MAG: hypothetical protein Q4G33_14775 [bacterium]|nr:hypothetical protein [bacterium]
MYSIKELEDAHDDMERWLSDMLLDDEIRLKDIPRTMRIASDVLYVTAFRISNSISCRRFVQDLQVLCKDLYMMASGTKKEYLIDTLSTALSINDHKGEEEFVYFKNNIYESVLQDLRRHEEDVRENIVNAVSSCGERKEGKGFGKVKILWRKIKTGNNFENHGI